jgi:ABC-type amino acid transport substrate-binding protein
VEQALEPGQSLAIAEDALGNPAAVDLTVLAQDRLAEALDQGGLDLRIRAEQMVDDLVARDDGGAVARERLQRLALARPDAAGDGD